MILVLFQRVDTGAECCLEPDVFVATTEKQVVKKAINYLLSLDDDPVEANAESLMEITKAVDFGEWLDDHYDIMDYRLIRVNNR